MGPYRSGNADDFDRLYRDSYSRILKTVFGILGDRGAAEDCTQEAFVRAYKAWGRWKADAPAEAWLHRIAFRVAISHKRHTRLRSLPELLRRVGLPGVGKDVAGSIAEGDALMSALHALPPEQAAAVVLRHHHGYSNREIAAALGIPESTVSARLGMARKKLSVSLHEPSAGSASRLTRPRTR